MPLRSSLSTASLAPDHWLQSLVNAPLLQLSAPCTAEPQVRLIRLDEINEEGHQAYRQALANVYASLDPAQPVRLLYLLDGGPTGVALYFGVVADTGQGQQAHEAMKNLRGALEGQLPGINFGDDVTPEARATLLQRLCSAPKQGVMLGTPTVPCQEEAQDGQNFQGIDRLVRALQSGARHDQHNHAHWQVAVTSQPLARQQIRQLLDSAYNLSSQLAGLVRTSVQTSGNTSRQKSASTGTSQATGRSDSQGTTQGKSESGTQGNNQGSSSSKNHSSSSTGNSSGSSISTTIGTNENRSTTKGTSHTQTGTENFSLSNTEGNSLGITHEIANKRAQHLLDCLDKQLIARLQKGLTKGLFHSAVYLAAEDNTTYQRLKNTLRATFQGSETTMSPLEVHDLPADTHRQLLRLPTLTKPEQPPEGWLFHNLHLDVHNALGSLLTADELAIVASLPQHELQGIRRRKTVDFIVDLPDVGTEQSLKLGAVIDRGRHYPNNPVRLNRADLNKHVFVTGVTGAGKTTTCLNLLLESNLPFLVIEPAKTEYRELKAHLDETVDYYRPNGDEHQSLRLNPFALVREGQRIKSHAGFLKNVFAAIFPMEASMPMMVEAAILAAYEAKGWDIDENEFLPGGNPLDPLTRAWPTMSEMVCQLDAILPTYRLGQELQDKYRGSLVSRLRSLTDGTLGGVLDVPQSLDFQALLERRAVIELEELQGNEEKALLMALLLGGLNEAIRARYRRDPSFRQLTLIEEAHRLLSRPEPGDKAAAMAVEAFADMLAEVRKYGAGLIIADQIPAKLIPDVIKNTHSKIVHRLFAEDDRRTMGEAMMMNEEQRQFLPNLANGEAVVFCGGWHGPAHAAIRNDRAQTDNHLAQTLDIAACGVQQLWRERTRYYPQFCGLGWLSREGDAPTLFAQWVRETRQAQNQLLHLIASPANRPTQRATLAFERLKKWHTHWQPRAVQAQTSYAPWQAQATDAWPDKLLAAAWMALLLDANPKPHTEEQEVPSLIPDTPGKRLFLSEVCSAWLVLLADSATLSEWEQKKSAVRAADVREHLTHLARIKNF